MLHQVYIIIVNYKKWQDVVECLESVFCLKYHNYKVFVIDNDSKNDSLKHLIDWAENGTSQNNSLRKPIDYKHFFKKDMDASFTLVDLPPLVFIQNDENKGFAAGNNVVLQYLVNEDAYIWLLNPDMVVDSNALTEIIKFAAKQPLKSIIGCSVHFFSNPGKVYLYGGAKINFNSATVDLVTKVKSIPGIDFICGGSMFANANHYKDLGLLPEKYFLYWEETEWCYRGKQKGYKILVCTSAICYDKISTTIGKSFLADYYYTRNGLLFVSLYKKNKEVIVLFATFLRLTKRLVMFQWRQAWGVFKGVNAFLKIRFNENK